MDFHLAKFISQDISQHTDMDRDWNYSAHRGETAPAGISRYRWRIVNLWLRILFYFVSTEGHFENRDQIPLIVDA